MDSDILRDQIYNIVTSECGNLDRFKHADSIVLWSIFLLLLILITGLVIWLINFEYKVRLIGTVLLIVLGLCLIYYVYNSVALLRKNLS
jgi:hypothetical protein